MRNVFASFQWIHKTRGIDNVRLTTIFQRGKGGGGARDFKRYRVAGMTHSVEW